MADRIEQHHPRPTNSKRRKAALERLKDEGLRETEFLLSSPKNAARLRLGLAQFKARKFIERDLDPE
jgi:hypothetical protein